MSRDSDTDPETGAAERAGWSRRNVLKVSGAGVGLAAIGGVSLAAGQEGGSDGNETATDHGGTETETPTGTATAGDGTGGALVDDLIDPTFGYPLAADETDEVSVESTVDLVSEEGEGAHENFPRQPESEEEFGFEFYFDPVGLHVRPDEVVQFTVVAGEHTVTAFHEKFSTEQGQMPMRVPEDSPGFTSPPIVDGESWLYQFPTEGVYDVLCFPHFGFGMVARVVVFDPETSDIEDEAFAAPTADELPPNVALVFAADELDPGNIVDVGRVAWADLTIEAQQTETPGTETPGTETGEY